MLFVDGSGERFMNERDRRGCWVKVTRVNGRCIWQVFDDNYPGSDLAHARRPSLLLASGGQLRRHSHGPVPDPIGMITRSEVEMMTPCICDTIEELAAAMESARRYAEGHD